MNGNVNGGVSRKPRAKAFLQNKIFLIFFLPVILLIIIIAAALIIRLANAPDDSIPAAAPGDYIYVLPIKERAIDGPVAPGRDPFADGGNAAFILDGIMYNPEGTSIAVLRSSDSSYIVSPDDAVGRTGWVVSGVTADTVTITKNERSEILSLTADAVQGIFNTDTEDIG